MLARDAEAMLCSGEGEKNGGCFRAAGCVGDQTTQEAKLASCSSSLELPPHLFLVLSISQRWKGLLRVSRGDKGDLGTERLNQFPKAVRVERVRRF